MEKYLNKFYEIIDKIGKHNFVLIVFIFVALLSTGLYQTFSIYTESEGLSFINNIKTYSFILKANNEENSIIIAAGNSKNVDITVSNESETDLKYGLYYGTTGSMNDINIGYLENTSFLPSGVVPKGTSYVVTIKVDNFSSEDVTINFGLKYGFENGGDLGIDEGQYWLAKYEEREITYPLLSEMAPGSYVAYEGNNGCDTTEVNGWSSCSGKNANYVDDTNMGYCHDSNYKFNVNGWRIAYIEDNDDEDASNDNAVLISAGAPECLSNDGPLLDIDSFYLICANYCNTNYIKNGDCSYGYYVSVFESGVFEKITGTSFYNCFMVDGSIECGQTNSLIDNGGFYWINLGMESGWWSPVVRSFPDPLGNSDIEEFSIGEEYSNGVRPVLTLDSSIVVTGGTGTYEDPYIISNE